MIVATTRLDPTSLAYLQRVEKTRGASGTGAFFPMPSGVSSGAVTGWLIVLGLAALGIVAFLAWPGPETTSDFKAIAGWQMILTVVGVLFLALAVRRISRPKPKNALGSFRYFDALHMWVVSPRRVEAVPLESLQDIDGTFYRGSNTYSKIVLSFPARLTFPTGRLEFIIPGFNRPKVEFLVKFVHTMMRLRNSDDAGLRALAQSSPPLLAAVASRLAQGQNVGSLGDLPLGEEPPRPTESQDAEAPPRSGYVGALVPWLAAAAAGVLAIFLVPAVDRYLLDEYLFAQVPAQDTGDFTALDNYLHQLPDGRHAQQVHEMRDDRLFDKARHEADEKHSPSSLRVYLADATNVRHRDDAQTRINVFYDEAIARLKKRAEGEKVDEAMFQAVLALLEALKKTDKPIVTVGFRGSQDPTPTTQDQKDEEQAGYEGYLQENAELKNIADGSPDKTAILPLGETYSPANTKLREAVILDHLRDSVKKVLDADILTLEPASEPAPGAVELPAPPVMEVNYHAFADGGLYLYTTTTHDDLLGDQKRINGLLRGYEVEWSIKIRPPGVDKVYEYKVASKPAKSLKYDSNETDPSWAPYAIILYSAFDDMSRQLIQDFAVDPPPAPDSYSFSEVVHKP